MADPWADDEQSERLNRAEQDGPEVGFGEVWNIIAFRVARRRRQRQASGCRSFSFSPSTLGNANVFYRNLSKIAHHVPEGDLNEAALRRTLSRARCQRCM